MRDVAAALLFRGDEHGKLGCESAPGQLRPLFSAIPMYIHSKGRTRPAPTGLRLAEPGRCAMFHPLASASPN